MHIITIPSLSSCFVGGMSYFIACLLCLSYYCWLLFHRYWSLYPHFNEGINFTRHSFIIEMNYVVLQIFFLFIDPSCRIEEPHWCPPFFQSGRCDEWQCQHSPERKSYCDDLNHVKSFSRWCNSKCFDRRLGCLSHTRDLNIKEAAVAADKYILDQLIAIPAYLSGSALNNKNNSSLLRATQKNLSISFTKMDLTYVLGCGLAY